MSEKNTSADTTIHTSKHTSKTIKTTVALSKPISNADKTNKNKEHHVELELALKNEIQFLGIFYLSPTKYMRDGLFIYKANPIEMDQPKNNTYLQATTEKTASGSHQLAPKPRSAVTYAPRAEGVVP